MDVQQVPINLILNGLDASMANPEGDVVEITTARQGNRCTLAVRDFDPGIAAEVMPRLFNSFFF